MKESIKVRTLYRVTRFFHLHLHWSALRVKPLSFIFVEMTSQRSLFLLVSMNVWSSSALMARNSFVSWTLHWGNLSLVSTWTPIWCCWACWWGCGWLWWGCCWWGWYCCWCCWWCPSIASKNIKSWREETDDDDDQKWKQSCRKRRKIEEKWRFRDLYLPSVKGKCEPSKKGFSFLSFCFCHLRCQIGRLFIRSDFWKRNTKAIKACFASSCCCCSSSSSPFLAIFSSPICLRVNSFSL